MPTAAISPTLQGAGVALVKLVDRCDATRPIPSDLCVQITEYKRCRMLAHEQTIVGGFAPQSWVGFAHSKSPRDTLLPFASIALDGLRRKATTSLARGWPAQSGRPSHVAPKVPAPA